MGNDGVVDEAEERGAVVLVVTNRRLQRLGREQRRRDGIHPSDEAIDDGAHLPPPMLAELLSGEAELLRRFFFTVERADEGAAFGGEDGLGVFGVAELPATVGVAPGLEYAT